MFSGPGPGARPGNYVRIERREVRTRHGAPRTLLQLHIGRAVWHQLGDPPQVSVQRLGGAVWLRPGEEYTVSAPAGRCPRITCGGSADLLVDHPDGRYTYQAAGGAIVLVPIP